MNKKQQLKYINDNYPLYTNHFSKRRIRHDFFKNINTEIQAYLLGFYTADGSINEKRKTFRVQLSQKDAEIVYLFKDIISPDARLFTTSYSEQNIIRNKPVIDNGSIGIDITSTILVNDLVDLGIGYRKTYLELKIPKIPEDLIRHFIRGYFDGDGSIRGTLRKAEPKTNRKERMVQNFSIDAKLNSLLLEFQKYFKDHEITTYINYLKRDDMFRLSSSSKKEVSKLFKLLYENSNFYLNRKYDIFNYHVNTEVNQLIIDHRNAQGVNVNESNNLPKSVEHPEGMKICAEPSDD